MGNIKSGEAKNGTDGIVPYQSSVIGKAQSELVVKSGHSVQEHPTAILEVRRILELHLERAARNMKKRELPKTSEKPDKKPAKKAAKKADKKPAKKAAKKSAGKPASAPAGGD